LVNLSGVDSLDGIDNDVFPLIDVVTNGTGQRRSSNARFANNTYEPEKEKEKANPK
jgi:hypothetical protein